MQPIRGGPKSRGPFKGPVLDNLGTGETPGGVLYVNRPSRGWAAPDILPNIALLALAAAVYVAPPPIDPTIAKRPVMQIDLAPNIAAQAALTYRTVAPVYVNRPSKAWTMAPDILPNIAVLAPALVTWTDEIFLQGRRPTTFDLYPNIAVTSVPPPLVLIPAPIEPTLARRLWGTPDLYPNIAVQFQALPFIPVAFAEPWISKRLPPQIDYARNVAALAFIEPSRYLPAPIEPISWQHRFQIEPSFNVAVLTAVPPPPPGPPGIWGGRGALPGKKLDETVFEPMDFISNLQYLESIISATVVAKVYTGHDANPSAILKGLPTIQGTVVYQLVTGGVVGTIYGLLYTATTSLNRTIQMAAYLIVEPDLV